MSGIADGGKAELMFYAPGSSPSSGAVSTSTINDGLWHHIVVTKDGTTYKLYVSSTLVATTSDFPDVLLGGDKNSIGYARGGGSEYLLGQVDEVVVLNRVLTASRSDLHASLAGAIDFAFRISWRVLIAPS